MSSFQHKLDSIKASHSVVRNFIHILNPEEALLEGITNRDFPVDMITKMVRNCIEHSTIDRAGVSLYDLEKYAPEVVQEVLRKLSMQHRNEMKEYVHC